MKSKFYITVFFLSCISFMSVAQEVAMTETESATLRTMVIEKSKTTASIESDFVQKKHLDFLSNDITSNGKLYFKSPNSIKWEYVQPFKYSVTFNGEMLYINDGGQKSDIKLGSSKMFKRISKLIISSVKGDMFDESRFEIAYFKNGDYSEVHFSPIDKKLSEYIASFHVLFDNDGEVVEVKMIEPMGDYTEIIFSNRTLNNPILDAVFTN